MGTPVVALLQTLLMYQGLTSGAAIETETPGCPHVALDMTSVMSVPFRLLMLYPHADFMEAKHSVQCWTLSGTIKITCVL